MSMLLWIALGTALLSVLLTGAVRQHAIARAILDVPNERSSHAVPKPRGGGLAIVASSQVAFAVLAWRADLPMPLWMALAPGGLAIAAIGWADDRRPLSAKVRVLVHAMTASWAVAWLGGLPALALGVATIPFGALGFVLAVLGIIWATNLYNFMDGIDGLAAGQAVMAAGAAAPLALTLGHSAAGGAAAAVAGAALGFLAWNWAPARIFMGDVGSGYLGYIFGVFAVAGERSGGVPILAWVALLALFVADATLTLVRRVLRGEAWHAAHRTHAYQRAVDLWGRHARVTGVCLMLTLPLAALAWWGSLVPTQLGLALVFALLLAGGAYVLVERRRPMRT